jgi:hypothetical protein
VLIRQSLEELALPVVGIALVLVREQAHVRLPVILTGEQPADIDTEVRDEPREDIEVRLLGLVFDDVAQLVRIDIELACGGDQVTLELPLEETRNARRQIAAVESGHGTRVTARIVR